MAFFFTAWRAIGSCSKQDPVNVTLRRVLINKRDTAKCHRGWEIFTYKEHYNKERQRKFELVVDCALSYVFLALFGAVEHAITLSFAASLPLHGSDNRTPAVWASCV